MIYDLEMIAEARLRIEYLEIDDQILDKIERRHSVSFWEVEEACAAVMLHVRRSREGLYKIFSQSQAGRYLLVVLARRDGGVWKVVTARDLTAAERRLYQRERGD